MQSFKGERLLGEAIIKAKAIEVNILPKNNVNFEFEDPMKIQPMNAIGERSIIVFLLPSFPDKTPPKGAKIITRKKSKEANQEPSS